MHINYCPLSNTSLQDPIFIGVILVLFHISENEEEKSHLSAMLEK